MREATRSLPTSVAGICAVIDGAPVGFASSSVVGVSYAPPLMSFCVQNSSTTWPVLSKAHRLGVSFLSHGQQGIAQQLSSRFGDRFAGLDITRLPSGAVLISGAPLKMECTVAGVHPAGDHHIVLMHVDGLDHEHDEAGPLVYFRRGFTSVSA